MALSSESGLLPPKVRFFDVSIGSCVIAFLQSKLSALPYSIEVMPKDMELNAFSDSLSSSGERIPLNNAFFMLDALILIIFSRFIFIKVFKSNMLSSKA